MSLLEIFHTTFLYLLFVLDSLLHAGRHILFSSDSVFIVKDIILLWIQIDCKDLIMHW